MTDADPISGGLRTDTRAVSTILTYVLALLVVSLLTSAVFVGVGGVVENEHEGAVHGSMAVVGERLAADLRTADRLARAADGDPVAVTSALPERVGGSTYVIDVTHLGGDRYELAVRSDSPEIAVAVTVRSRTDVREGRVRGGTLEIRYDPSADELVVRRAD